MTLPIMEPDLDRGLLRTWVEAVDRGPYSSLAFGERMLFSNPETMALMGACAAWTERVRLVTTIFIATLHSPVLLAKHIATADMLSNGRVTIGVGIGGREEDYAAVGADLSLRKQKELAARVDVMRRAWAGEHVVPGVARAVGPAPVQPGGPPVLAGAMGPKAIAGASHWADGVCGMSFAPDVGEIDQSFTMVRQAWADAGRPKPHLGTSFWFALGDNARDQMRTHLKRYFTWLPPAEVDAIAEHAGFAGSDKDFKALLHQIADTGADEIMLISTSSDPDQIHRVADLIG